MNNLIADLIRDRSKQRKSIATTEMARKELESRSSFDFSDESFADQESRRRINSLITLSENEEMLKSEPLYSPTKTNETYAEFYLKTKRSGSLAVPVSEYTDEQRSELLNLFNLYDLDKDNKLGINDLMKIFSTINPKEFSREKVTEFIKSASNYESETEINFQQFMQFIGGTYFGKFSRVELRQVFEWFDRDSDGYLLKEDVKRLIDEAGWTEKFNVDTCFTKMDFDQDGKVNFDDFKYLMNNLKF